MPRDPIQITIAATMIEHIKLDAIAESPTNPRRTFGKQSLAELAESMRLDGVLQPILVRPTPDGAKAYEVVFGHRRLRAARQAGLATVPCMVRDMSADVAARKQVVENLQREDLHPLEEAEGFDAMLRHHGATVADLVQQTGKSRSYIYARAKLLALDELCRKAFYDGEIDAEVAKHIATLPPGRHQARALAIATESTHNGDPKSFRQFIDELEDTFNLNLNQAPWRLDDATLLADRPSCLDCGERSGKVPELYSEIIKPQRKWAKGVHGENVCRNVDCHSEKKRAYLDRVAAELEAKGKKVITGNKARAATAVDTGYGSDRGTLRIKENSAYVPLEAVREELKQAKAKGAAVEPVTIVDPRSGRKLEAVAKADLQAAGVKVASEKAGKANSRATDRDDGGYRHRQEVAKQQTELRRALWKSIYDKMLDTVRGVALSPQLNTMIQLISTEIYSLAPDDSDGRLSDALGVAHDHEKLKARVLTLPHANQLVAATGAVLSNEIDAEDYKTAWEARLTDCARLLEAARQFMVPLPEGLITNGKIPAPKKAQDPNEAAPAAKKCAKAKKPKAEPVGTLSAEATDQVLRGSASNWPFSLGAEEKEESAPAVAGEGNDADPLYEQAVAIVREHKRGSISLVQRHLAVGYNRAARLLEAMEAAGVVSAMDSRGNRTVLPGAPAVAGEGDGE
jgi:ParB/RepB/Spo0J family partition protein